MGGQTRTSYAASAVAVSPSHRNREFTVSDISLAVDSLAAKLSLDIRQSGPADKSSSGDDSAPASPACHRRPAPPTNPPPPAPTNPGDRKPGGLAAGPGGVAMLKWPLMDIRLPDAKLPDAVVAVEGLDISEMEVDDRSVLPLLPAGCARLRARDLRRTAEAAAGEVSLA